MASSIWDEAVIKDGEYVLYQVTTRLYKGDSVRPDVYYQYHPELGGTSQYKRNFTSDQRKIIESIYSMDNYDIEEAARYFDISLHLKILQHLCVLKTSGSLWRKLQEVGRLRNSVAHRSAYDTPSDSEDYDEKLDQLLDLYMGILEDLEEYVDDDLNYEKSCIRNQIIKKKKEVGKLNNSSMSSWGQPKFGSPKGAGVTKKESEFENLTNSGLSNWGKVGVGLAIGAGVLGLLAAMSSDSKDKTKKRSSQ